MIFEYVNEYCAHCTIIGVTQHFGLVDQPSSSPVTLDTSCNLCFLVSTICQALVITTAELVETYLNDKEINIRFNFFQANFILCFGQNEFQNVLN